VAEDGYRLVAESALLRAGSLTADTAATFAFDIVDADGMPVTRFDQLHDRVLHLIVLSRNTVDYLHLHPTMDSRGRWTVDLPALAAGSYRMYADFQPTGAANLTLATDLSVPGDVRAVELPRPGTMARIDGYTVSMTGEPSVGDEPLTFTVLREGAVVRPDPYLGAPGHLIAIRTGGLA